MKNKTKCIDKSSDINDIIKTGTSIRIWFSENHFSNQLIHVRAVVDDFKVVYRVWLRHKNYWGYYIESLYYLELLLKDGKLFKIK